MKRFYKTCALLLCSLTFFSGCSRVSDLEKHLNPEKQQAIEENTSQALKVSGEYFQAYQKGDLEALKKIMTEKEYGRYTKDLDTSFISQAKAAGLDEKGIQGVEKRVAQIYGSLVQSWDVVSSDMEDDLEKATVYLKVHGRRESSLNAEKLNQALKDYWQESVQNAVDTHSDEYWNLVWTVGEDEALEQIKKEYLKDYVLGQYDVVEKMIKALPEEDAINYRLKLDKKDGKWLISSVDVAAPDSKDEKTDRDQSAAEESSADEKDSSDQKKSE